MPIASRSVSIWMTVGRGVSGPIKSVPGGGGFRSASATTPASFSSPCSSMIESSCLAERMNVPFSYSSPGHRLATIAASALFRAVSNSAAAPSRPASASK